MREKLIVPSLLSADFGRMAESAKIVERAGAKRAHLDVMDGHFVDNITFGPAMVEALRKESGMVFDTHLMICNPGKFIDRFVSAGSDVITIHLETVEDAQVLLRKIRDRGKKPGVSINPETDISSLKKLLDKIDVVLFMGVHPGFGGQKFIPEVFGKMREIRKTIDENNLDVDVEIDGGVNMDNIGEMTDAGANLIVAGSAIFHAEDPAGAFRELTDKLQAPNYKFQITKKSK